MIQKAIDKDADGSIDVWHYHHENQLSPLVGPTNQDGDRVAEIDTGILSPKQCFGSSTFAARTGDVYQKVIQFDGRPSRVSEVTSPEEDVTRITLDNGYTYAETVEGAVLRAVNADGAYTAIVTDFDDEFLKWIEVDDPSDEILEFVGNGADFFSRGRGASARVRSLRELFGNRMGSVSGGANTGGTWDGAVYNMTEDTSLIDADDAFDSYFTGWHVQVDASLPVYFEILDADGDEIKVSGDVTGMITTGETNFMIIHPVGVDPETGATQEDPCVPESRYIWGGGLYLPPVAGFTTNLGVEGAQPNSNMSGQHYMWNRVYDINTGRWTTPDPAAQPWWNLASYVDVNPLGDYDPSGLANCELSIYTYSVDKTDDEHASEDDCISFGANGFLAAVKAFFLDNPNCTCITKLTVIGHGCSGLGRGDDFGDLEDEDLKYLRYAMCSSATIEIRKCDSHDCYNDYDILTVMLGGDSDDATGGTVVDGSVTPGGWVLPFSDRRRWIVPEDAGYDYDARTKVAKLNKALWACKDTYEASVGGFLGSSVPHFDDSIALDNYKECVTEAWDDYHGK